MPHYFSADTKHPESPRDITVRIADRDVTVATAAGVFSAAHVDAGTQVLLRKTPRPPTSGHLLDLGCGWGPIALHLALTSPDAEVWATDVNPVAVQLTATNAARLNLTHVHATLADAVPPELRFEAIWSNPPIRIGKTALHELLRLWLPRLTPQGSAHLVVQRHLGADPLQSWLAQTWPERHVTRTGSAKGFRVLSMEPR